MGNGVDVVSDGEQGKPGFFSYVNERLDGFEPRPGPFALFEAEVRDFPEYYKDYFAQAMLGGTVVNPKVMWAKFEAMAEGARLASQQLWG